jgi:hypothetical protein
LQDLPDVLGNQAPVTASGGPMSKIEVNVEPPKTRVESDESVSAQTSDVDWNRVREWDERYVFHVLATEEEYYSNPVESADGCYITLADGRRSSATSGRA